MARSGRTIAGAAATAFMIDARRMLEDVEAYGLKFRVPAGDTAVGACLRDYGEFARPELDFLLDHADAASGTFVDVGAHLGTVSLPFARARPGWRVISIEAAYALANLIVEAAAANGIGNVEVLSVAAGEAAGVAEFPAVELWGSGNFGAIGFEHPQAARRKVGVRPLDDIAPDDTRLIKVDVEGYEAHVLRGAPRLLGQVRPIWVLEAHRGKVEQTRTVAGQLTAHDYRLFWFFSPFATPTAPRAPSDPSRGDLGLVAIPAGQPRWDLPAVVDVARPPTNYAEFPYLRRYGYAG
jgi:FkbM family methyltransferase